MTQIDYTRAARYLLLQEVLQGLNLTSIGWVMGAFSGARYKALRGFYARWAVGG